ncbi:DMT family transporter [Peribacillus psychrosaccharolyticus]|uniref:DMT family transporter n=1 Tax=Peribacillus psychrosaccharolyticus TaxID=1407 RepID=A0A974NKH1_PERPY|nr:DMT family transporter [Peribacillus psychrosaccharolyticus]MEC2055785.1 DMT family transporter [Peribacillus psychrosaccharolyticus]MED3743189.1 DMT family transporter [Peribacillus psychrosaccharolyticus]QQS99432.1 DMT family transporter [Peribacillus psychrosaccharolyticus]
MKQPKINPYFVIAIGVVSVSSSAIFVKLATAESAIIAFYRLMFSVLLMLPLFLMKYRMELTKVKKMDWMLASAAGIFLAFHFILWFESLTYTSVASSTVLVTLQPIFAFAGAYFFYKERFSVKAILSGVVAVLGSLLISWGDFKVSGLALIGDMLAIIACGLITAYLLLGQTVRKRLSSITYTFIVYSASTITLFIYAWAAGNSFGPYPASDWIYFILLAIFPNLLGHSLFNWSLRWVSTTTISMAILLEPIGAALLAYWLLGETIQWTQAVGGAIILASLMIFLRDEQNNSSGL